MHLHATRYPPERLASSNRAGTLHATGGQAMLIAVVFFLMALILIVDGVVGPIYAEVRALHEAYRSQQSYFTAEGLLEDVTYRLLTADTVDPLETMTLAGTRATATTAVIAGGDLQVVSRGDTANAIRKVANILTVGSGVSFAYGVQAGEGGFIMENSSSIRGNAFSNGPVDGEGTNLIKGDVISAGPSGLVDGIHATSSAFSHTITNSIIDKNAHYQSISGSTVGGTSYPGSPDQATSSLPIPDSQVATWEADAEAGGTLVCSGGSTHVINSSVALGPIKIPCDLEIQGSPIITLGGSVWVVGDIDVQNSAVMQIDPALGARSVAVIADDPSDRLAGSKISLKNNTNYYGSGTSPSYVLLLSMNNSAESGGGNSAIQVDNSAQGDLLVYAGHGEILLQNNIDLREVTAWRIHLKNSAEVIYESGLANLLFTALPTGGFNIDTWREVE